MFIEKMSFLADGSVRIEAKGNNGEPKPTGYAVSSEFRTDDALYIFNGEDWVKQEVGGQGGGPKSDFTIKTIMVQSQYGPYPVQVATAKLNGKLPKYLQFNRVSTEEPSGYIGIIDGCKQLLRYFSNFNDSFYAEEALDYDPIHIDHSYDESLGSEVIDYFIDNGLEYVYMASEECKGISEFLYEDDYSGEQYIELRTEDYMSVMTFWSPTTSTLGACVIGGSAPMFGEEMIGTMVTKD